MRKTIKLKVFFKSGAIGKYKLKVDKEEMVVINALRTEMANGLCDDTQGMITFRNFSVRMNEIAGFIMK